MVYSGNKDAETKTYAGVLRQQSDLTVQEIVHLCGIKSNRSICFIVWHKNDVMLFGHVTSGMRDFCKITIKAKHLH